MLWKRAITNLWGAKLLNHQGVYNPQILSSLPFNPRDVNASDSFWGIYPCYGIDFYPHVANDMRSFSVLMGYNIYESLLTLCCLLPILVEAQILFLKADVADGPPLPIVSGKLVFCPGLCAMTLPGPVNSSDKTNFFPKILTYLLQSYWSSHRGMNHQIWCMDNPLTFISWWVT